MGEKIGKVIDTKDNVLAMLAAIAFLGLVMGVFSSAFALTGVVTGSVVVSIATLAIGIVASALAAWRIRVLVGKGEF